MSKPEMMELKFRTGPAENMRSSCECPGSASQSTSASDSELEIFSSLSPCCQSKPEIDLPWVTGILITPVCQVRKVSTGLTRTDYWEHIKCRTTSFRNDYKVEPGLYAVGEPDKNSDVLVSANYKYSFDMLRSELRGIDAWVLVLDTKGINVWCAAGKGTFGTEELIRRISMVQLDKIVEHRRVIVPQLGAPGVSAFRVKQATGFRVLFGPVYAKDVPAYIRAGHKTTREMRRVKFSLSDRLILTPMEINPVMKKYPFFAAIVLIAFGLTPSGIMFRDALVGGFPFLILGLMSVFAGAFLSPVLLPYIPARSFAIKGWLIGFAAVFLSLKFIPLPDRQNIWLTGIEYLLFPLASSYIALQFTGSTTFTGMSGVKKELKIAMPVYLFSCAASAVLLIIFKLTQWRVI